MTLLSAMATLVFVRTISRLLPLLGGQVTYHGLPLLPETVHVAITRNFLTKSIPLKIHRDQLRTGWYKCFDHTDVWFVCLRIAFTSPALAKASSASISSYSKAKWKIWNRVVNHLPSKILHHKPNKYKPPKAVASKMASRLFVRSRLQSCFLQCKLRTWLTNANGHLNKSLLTYRSLNFPSHTDSPVVLHIVLKFYRSHSVHSWIGGRTLSQSKSSRSSLFLKDQMF